MPIDIYLYINLIMKIIITENQLNNISLRNNWLENPLHISSKKIIVTESQYSKLLISLFGVFSTSAI